MYGGVMRVQQMISKVSVIIPIYNAEKYLALCLDSVINQTFTDIEIICVDDGSSDSSLQISQGYAAKDDRIKIIHKENGGLVSARKTGLAAARGEYIGFVDSDDWIEPDMYERLYDAASKYQVDMVSCGYFLEGNYTTVHLDTVDSGLYDASAIEYLRDNTIYRLERKETGLRGSLCCKLFRREIFEAAQMEVPECITIAEDKMCLLHFMLHCRSAYVMHEAFYHWCIHQESMSHKGNVDYLIRVNDVYRYLRELYSHENFTEAMRTQAEIYIMELLVLGINTRMGFQHRNILRIDPSWMDQISQNARVVLYGGGDVGEQYARQMRQREDIQCAADLGFDMPSAEKLQQMQFDVIVIAIKNPGKAKEVKTAFLQRGVHPDKILWVEHPEVYWKYAKAEGLLDSIVFESEKRDDSSKTL